MRQAVIVGAVRTPMGRYGGDLAKGESAFDRRVQAFDTTIGWRFTNPKSVEKHYPYGMGETAENVARKYEISRQDQDAFAFASQQKTARAMDSGRFDDEIVSVEIPQRKGDPVVVSRDEHPRPDTTLEKLAKLRPAFAKDDRGTVTAGNSSGINDGAAAVLLVELETARRLGLTPLAVVGRSATAGVDPACMGLGPIPATKKVLERAALSIGDLDIIELNEAFAAQSLACIRELGLEDATINPNGGAIALGHPLGCTGARLVTTLVHEMVKTGTKRGLATLCVGVGQGAATLVEGV
ncbi:MAG: acetyl-CoA C-acyltransferase [bacterium]|nr:acetyl-CoA C-acyltransferase [bacterium]